MFQCPLCMIIGDGVEFRTDKDVCHRLQVFVATRHRWGFSLKKTNRLYWLASNASHARYKIRSIPATHNFPHSPIYLTFTYKNKIQKRPQHINSKPQMHASLNSWITSIFSILSTTNTFDFLPYKITEASSNENHQSQHVNAVII